MVERKGEEGLRVVGCVQLLSDTLSNNSFFLTPLHFTNLHLPLLTLLSPLSLLPAFFLVQGYSWNLVSNHFRFTCSPYRMLHAITLCVFEREREEEKWRGEAVRTTKNKINL